MTCRHLPPLLFLATAALLRGAAESQIPASPVERSSLSALAGEVAGFQISGPHSEANLTEIFYSGGARLVSGDVLLLADEIHFNTTTQVAVAKGHVTLSRGSQRLLADEITYQLKTRSYVVKGLRLGDAPLYVSGSGLVGDGKAVTVKDAQLTYSEPGPWTPMLHADSLTYTPGEKIHAERAHLGFGLLQPIPLPTFNQSVKDPLFKEFTFRAGYRSTLGAFLEAGALVPEWPDAQLGGDFGLYTGRGVLVGPAAAYKIDQPGLSAEGTLHSGYIHDYGNRLTDILGRPVPADRGFVDWTHHEQIGDNLTVLGQLNYWSDSEVIRDFRPTDFFPVQTPDNFLETDYTGTNTILSAFVRAQPDSFFQVQQRLPEVRFDLLPTAMGGGFYERLGASAVRLREDALTVGPTLTSDRLDAVYEVSRPISPTDWFTFEPVAGGRITHYADATGGRSAYTRGLGEVGADAELRASATYDYVNEFQGINGLRHLVTPTLSYRYIPAADRGTPYIPAIDRDVFSTALQPLGLADQRNIDQLHDENTLRVGLNNTLQTRDPLYGSRDLVTLDWALDWRFDPAAGERPLSALYTSLALMPAPWLRFDLFNRLDPQTGGLRELNTGLTLHDGDAWTVRLSTHYLQHQLQEYVFDGSYRLNEVNELVSRIHYDARLDRFVQQDYGLRQNLGNLWSVRYLVEFSQGSARENSVGFNIEVELKKF